MPHGGGHKGTGTWRRANQEGGANINELASSDPADVERLVGMSHLSGIRIRAERVAARSAAQKPEPAVAVSGT
ncbi:hypothetical protein [Hoyosella subflava]|uniref:hypothetical protein n=1 Tax=Hoyosella subflava TaxID=639313 RepID=UPI001ED96C80|nr:hypothetical protein [Hoyosella subflava]